MPENQLPGVFLRKAPLCKPVACAVRYVSAPRAEVNIWLNFGEEKTNTGSKHLTSAILNILSLLFLKHEKLQ
ncbi:hypothetical protein [Pseudomonas retamae]|uniref:Uncharacterized protein n=1 Tax=Pseudomonas retamae TaxID=702110 RepID=A0ABW7DKH6_9PSED